MSLFQDQNKKLIVATIIEDRPLTNEELEIIDKNLDQTIYKYLQYGYILLNFQGRDH